MNDSTALVPVNDSAPALAVSSLDEAVRLASLLADAGEMIPSHYRGRPSALLAAILAATDYRIGVWEAIQNLYIVDGTVEMSAILMRKLARRAGHRIVKVRETRTEVVVRLIRCDDDGDYVESFTIDEAVKAGLIDKKNWQRYPSDMLFNRASARLLRRHAPDAIGSAYLLGETRSDAAQMAARFEAYEIIGLAEAATTTGEVEAIAEKAEQLGVFALEIDGVRVRDVLTSCWKALNAKQAEPGTPAGEIEVEVEAATEGV